MSWLFVSSIKNPRYFWAHLILGVALGFSSVGAMAGNTDDCQSLLTLTAIRSESQNIQLNQWGFTTLSLESFSEGSLLINETENIWMELSKVSELGPYNRGNLNLINDGWRSNSKSVTEPIRTLLLRLANEISLLLNKKLSWHQRTAHLSQGEVRLRIGPSPSDDILDFHVDRTNDPILIVTVPLIGRGTIVRYAGQWPHPESIPLQLPAWGRSHVELYRNYEQISLQQNEILILSTTGASDNLGIEPTVHSAPLTDQNERRMTVLFSYRLRSIE